ncbi:hypothetical protein NicSoilC12_15430 [Arthrobacter sp. NicSoilC12]|nr:hypothetical protein NicSoilC12_15430 [Arthrobacter sp. NicSoilC12]
MNFKWSFLIMEPGSRCDSVRIWKPFADAQHGQLGLGIGGVDDPGHQRREAGDRAGAEVIAVREPAGNHDGVNVTQSGAGVPELHRGGAGQTDRTGGVAVVEGAGEGDDADLRTSEPASTRSVGGDGDGLADQGEFSHFRPQRPRR